MDEILRDHLSIVVGLICAIIASVFGVLWKIGWLNIPKKVEPWDGHDRRQCAQHPFIQDKVCSLYVKLDGLDTKIDTLSEKVHTVIGALEQRWGKKVER